MSPFFTEAVSQAAVIRTELAPEAKLVLISNGTGLLNPAVFDFLEAQCKSTVDLHIWLKLDAATEAWYLKINRSDIPHKELYARIRDFAASHAPFIIQTMICKVEGANPPPEEKSAWVQLVTELAILSAKSSGSEKETDPKIRMVQIYGKARPASEDPLAEEVPVSILEERASLLRQSFGKAIINIPIEVYE